jgi:thiol-disulfide isomerase/thioredoxin
MFLVFLNGSSYAQQIPKWKITKVTELFKNTDSIIIINFWATFCGPCIEEIPDLIKMAKKYEKQKVKLYLVSLDFADAYPTKIKKFVAQKKYKTNVAWLDETDADYFCPLVDYNWSGSIPATLIINSTTGVKQFFEKKLSATEMDNAIKHVLVN